VTEVTPNGLKPADGTVVASELIVSAAGIKAPEVLRRLDGLEINRINQLVVESTLQTRDNNVFAIDDRAVCPQPGTSVPVPPRAQAGDPKACHHLCLDARRDPRIVYATSSFALRS
jgi:NADH:ubiquinone reductase (H+-translocating)